MATAKDAAILGLLAASLFWQPCTTVAQQTGRVGIPVRTGVYEVHGPDDASPGVESRIELQALLIKIGVGSALSTLAAGLVVFLLGRRHRASAAGNKQIWVKDAIGVSPKCRVALLQFGDREVLVGHDHTGLRSMVLVPSSFSSALETVEALPTDPLVTNTGFLKVEDRGWDLMHRA